MLGSVSSREKNLWEFLRGLTDEYSDHNLSRVPVALRWERGEIGDRPHAHALIAGFYDTCISKRWMYATQEKWNRLYGKAGCRIRPYRSFHGNDRSPEYLVKMRERDKQNAYEVSKFDKADRLVINDAAWRIMLQESGQPYVPQFHTY